MKLWKIKAGSLKLTYASTNPVLSTRTLHSMESNPWVLGGSLEENFLFAVKLNILPLTIRTACIPYLYGNEWEYPTMENTCYSNFWTMEVNSGLTGTWKKPNIWVTSNIRTYVWFTKKEMAAHLFLSSRISHWSFDIICMALTAVGSAKAWAMGETPLKL